MKDNLKSVGLWGQLHYQYLQKTRPSFIGVMRMNGELLPYLQDIDKQADEMNYQLVKEYAKREGVTEKLKAENQMAWVGAMNNIQSRVREMVLNDLIYV